MASSSQTRSLWFEGSAAEATHISKTQRKLLVVLLAGTDVKGKAVQLLFQRPELEDVLRDQVVLKLEDDLTNTDPAAFSDAKAFRVFFPAAELPAVYCLGLKGALLSSSQGFQVNPIREALTKARAAFDEQVKAQTTQEALAALMALAQQHAAQHLGSTSGQPAAPAHATAAPGAQAPAALARTPDVGPASGSQGDPTAPANSSSAAQAAAARDKGKGPADAGDEPSPSSLPGRLLPASEASGSRTPASVDDCFSGSRSGSGSGSGSGSMRARLSPVRTREASGDGTSGSATVSGPGLGSLPAGQTTAAVGAAAENGDDSGVGLDTPRPYVPPVQSAQPAAAPLELLPDLAPPPAPANRARSFATEAAPAPPPAAAPANRASSTATETAPTSTSTARSSDAHVTAAGTASGSDRAAGAAAPAAHGAAEEGGAAGPASSAAPAAGPSAEAGQKRKAGEAAAARLAMSAAHAPALDPAKSGQPPPSALPAAEAAAGTAGTAGAAGTADTADRTRTHAPSVPKSTPGAAGSPSNAANVAFEADQGALQDQAEPAMEAMEEVGGTAVAPSPHLSPMASLSFRLTNGSQLRADFPSDTPLHEVRTFLDLNRTDGGVPYILTTPYPRREFGPGDLDQSLLDLGLAPRSAIILQPTAGGAAGRLGSSGSTGGLVGGVTGAVGGIVGGVGSIVGGVWGGVKSLWGGGGSGGVSGGEAGSGPPQAQQALGGRSGGFGQLGQPGSGSGSAPGGPGASAAVRRRPFGSGHISGLHDGDDQQPDKAGNSYWNGNSTQYDGDDADKR